MTRYNPLEYESPRDRLTGEPLDRPRSRRLGATSCVFACVALALVIAGFGPMTRRGQSAGLLAAFVLFAGWVAFAAGLAVGLVADLRHRCWQSVVGVIVNLAGAAAPIIRVLSIS